jgi:hypothetical protein
MSFGIQDDILIGVFIMLYGVFVMWWLRRIWKSK